MVQQADTSGILRSTSLYTRSWLYASGDSHHTLVGKMYQPEFSNTSSQAVMEASQVTRLTLCEDGWHRLGSVASAAPAVELPAPPRSEWEGTRSARSYVPHFFLLTFSSLVLSFATVILLLRSGTQEKAHPVGVSPQAKLASAYLSQFESALNRKDLRPKVERDRTYQVTQILKKAGHSKTAAGGLAQLIVSEAVAHGLDPLFVAAVIRHESTFRTNAVSSKGALGLMQLLPSTAQFVSKKSKIEWKGDSRLLDAHYNLKLGIRYLRYLQRTFHNWEHILVAYNWGPGNLQMALRNGGHVPQSTLRYARSIMQTHARWRGESPLPTISRG